MEATFHALTGPNSRSWLAARHPLEPVQTCTGFLTRICPGMKSKSLPSRNALRLVLAATSGPYGDEGWENNYCCESGDPEPLGSILSRVTTSHHLWWGQDKATTRVNMFAEQPLGKQCRKKGPDFNQKPRRQGLGWVGLGWPNSYLFYTFPYHTSMKTDGYGRLEL